jgi:hypothetical protein
MDNEALQAILDDINYRCEGDFNKLSISDKMVMKSLMQKIKADLVKWLDENLSIIEFWEGYSVEDDILKCKEPDLLKLRGFMEGSMGEFNINRIGGRL